MVVVVVVVVGNVNGKRCERAFRGGADRAYAGRAREGAERAGKAQQQPRRALAREERDADGPAVDAATREWWRERRVTLREPNSGRSAHHFHQRAIL